MTKIDRRFLLFYNQCAALGARAGNGSRADSQKFGSVRAGTGSRSREMAPAIADVCFRAIGPPQSRMGAE